VDIVNKYKLINNYLEQISNRAASTIVELNLLQKHIDDIKGVLVGKGEAIRLQPQNLPAQPISKKVPHQQPTDMIRIKEVMKMIGISKSTIYSFISNGTFPKPIKLGGRSVAWQRGNIEKWVLNKVNAT